MSRASDVETSMDEDEAARKRGWGRGWPGVIIIMMMMMITGQRMAGPMTMQMVITMTKEWEDDETRDGDGDVDWDDEDVQGLREVKREEDQGDDNHCDKDYHDNKKQDF